MRNSRSLFVAALGAGIAAGLSKKLSNSEPEIGLPLDSGFRIRLGPQPSKYTPHQGTREMARRAKRKGELK